MEMYMFRFYYPEGTNAALSINGEQLAFTIELPWQDNLPMVSCIPEGSYDVKRRWSPRCGRHLLVAGVPGRSLILFRPANDAGKQLKGCIAPVTGLTGPGRGTGSRKAFRKLMDHLGKAGKDEPHFLHIQKQTP